MNPLVSVLLGLVLLVVLFLRGGRGDRRFLGKSVLIALAVILAVLALLVLR